MTTLSSLLLASAACFVSVALTGCSPINLDTDSNAVGMADSFDVDFFGVHANDLHTPYLAGAQVGISVLANATRSEVGWTLSSSDPNVVQVISQLSAGSGTLVAGRPGQATLSILDSSGTVLDSQQITVAIPDQVSVYAQGLLATGASDEAAQVTQASIVAGGDATFLVRYFSQGTELFGSGAVKTSATGGVESSIVSESFATDRDFIQVSPPPMGSSGSVSLVVLGTVVSVIPITAVSPTAVKSVTVLPQSSVGAQTGDSLALYAHAIDANEDSVYGASFDWAINGETQPVYDTTTSFDAGSSGDDAVQVQQPNDLFFYTFDASALETVEATFEGFTQSMDVHGQGGSVGSTATQVACSLSGAPGTSGGAPAFAGLVLAMAGLVLARRRVTCAA